jgi:hypothetical protein
MEEAKKWVEDHKEDAVPEPEVVTAEGKGVPEDSVVSAIRTEITKEAARAIGSTVRFKSYGTVEVNKAMDGGPDSGDLFVRGFFTSDEQDEVGDIITKEATDKAIERWRQWGNIRTMHSFPSGRVAKIGEADGLAWNELITIPVDENTRKLIEGGVLKAYSVGIIPRVYDFNYAAMTDDAWFPPLVIHEYDMIEISYVDHPANYSATIQEVTEGKHKGVDAWSAVYRSNMDLFITDEGEIGMKKKEFDESGRNAEGLLAEDVAFHENPPEESVTVGAAGGEEEEYEEVEGEDSDLGFEDVLLAVNGIKEQVDQLREFVMSELPTLVANAIGSTEDEIPSEEDTASLVPDSEVTQALLENLKKDIVAEIVAGLRLPFGSRKTIVSIGDGKDDKADEVEKNKYLSMTPAERRKKLTEILEG